MRLRIIVTLLVILASVVTASAQELGGGVTGEKGRVAIGENLSGGFRAPEAIDLFGTIGVRKTADLIVAVGRGNHAWIGLGYQAEMEKGDFGRLTAGIVFRFGSGFTARPRIVFAQDVNDKVTGHIGATLLVENRRGSSSTAYFSENVNEEWEEVPVIVPQVRSESDYLGLAALAGITVKVGDKWRLAGEVVVAGGVFKGAIGITHDFGKLRVSREK